MRNGACCCSTLSSTMGWSPLKYEVEQGPDLVVLVGDAAIDLRDRVHHDRAHLFSRVPLVLGRYVPESLDERRQHLDPPSALVSEH